MKFRVIGAKRIEGLAKASGKPFDMCRAYCLVPVETGQGKTVVTGYGSEVAEMELDPLALPQFANLKFPADVELKIEQRFVFGEFRSIVIGVEGAVQPALAKVG